MEEDGERLVDDAVLGHLLDERVLVALEVARRDLELVDLLAAADQEQDLGRLTRARAL